MPKGTSKEIGNKLSFVKFRLVSNKWKVQNILCSAPLDTHELSNQIFRLQSPDLCGGEFEHLPRYTMSLQESDLHLGLYSS